MDIVVADSRLWLTFFDRRAAIEAVYTHIAALPSSRTEERHTLKAYEAGLKHFMAWIGDDLPTVDKVQAYIASLVQGGLASRTIASKYMAPLRHYLKHLSAQHIPGLTGEARHFVGDCREQLRQAVSVPTPKAETVSNVAPLWRGEFKRLTLQQVNAVLRHIDTGTLAGRRDYALLLVAFSTGLRLAELARISLSALTPAGGAYLITVRGKRSNVDPVPITEDAHHHIQAYVEAFNRGLSTDDPRRIVGSIPVWQPLHRERFYLAHNRYSISRGISHQAIRDIIAKRTGDALGKEWTLAPHDCRRTAAAIAYDAGMPITDIQQLLRHKEAAVTMRYVGTKPKFEDRMLGRLVAFG